MPMSNKSLRDSPKPELSSAVSRYQIDGLLLSAIMAISLWSLSQKTARIPSRAKPLWLPMEPNLQEDQIHRRRRKAFELRLASIQNVALEPRSSRLCGCFFSICSPSQLLKSKIDHDNAKSRSIVVHTPSFETPPNADKTSFKTSYANTSAFTDHATRSSGARRAPDSVLGLLAQERQHLPAGESYS